MVWSLGAVLAQQGARGPVNAAAVVLGRPTHQGVTVSVLLPTTDLAVLSGVTAGRQVA